MKTTIVQNASGAEATVAGYKIPPGCSLVLSTDQVGTALGSEAERAYVIIKPVSGFDAFGRPPVDPLAAFWEAFPAGLGMAGFIVLVWAVKQLRMARG